MGWSHSSKLQFLCISAFCLLTHPSFFLLLSILGFSIPMWTCHTSPMKITTSSRVPSIRSTVPMTSLTRTFPKIVAYDISLYVYAVFLVSLTHVYPLFLSLSLVHTLYSWGVIDFLHHKIGSTHVAHHFDSTIPHYKAQAATDAIKANFPEIYLYDPTPIPEALWRVCKGCAAVEKRGEYYIWDNKDVPEELLATE